MQHYSLFLYKRVYQASGMTQNTKKTTVCSPWCQLTNDTEVSTVIPPYYRAVSLLRLWDCSTRHSNYYNLHVVVEWQISKPSTLKWLPLGYTADHVITMRRQILLGTFFVACHSHLSSIISMNSLPSLCNSSQRQDFKWMLMLLSVHWMCK